MWSPCPCLFQEQIQNSQWLMVKQHWRLNKEYKGSFSESFCNLESLSFRAYGLYVVSSPISQQFTAFSVTHAQIILARKSPVTIAPPWSSVNRTSIPARHKQPLWSFLDRNIQQLRRTVPSLPTAAIQLSLVIWLTVLWFPVVELWSNATLPVAIVTCVMGKAEVLVCFAIRSKIRSVLILN